MLLLISSGLSRGTSICQLQIDVPLKTGLKKYKSRKYNNNIPMPYLESNRFKFEFIFDIIFRSLEAAV